MTMEERDRLRILQDRLLELAESLRLDDDLRISSEFPGSPTLRELRPVLWPEWSTVIERVVDGLERQERARERRMQDGPIRAERRPGKWSGD